MLNIKQAIKKILISNLWLAKIICLFNKKMSLLEVKSLTDYCTENDLIIKMVDQRTRRTTRGKAMSVEEYENNVLNLVTRPVSKSYIAEIKNASFIGETDGVFIDGKYLLERVEWDKGGVSNCLQDNIFALQEDRCILNNKDLQDRYVEKGIILLKMWSFNIFHFTFEVIARLITLDMYYEDKDVPILVDDIVRHDPRSMRLLKIANVYNRKIRWVKHNERITVGTAILPPCMAWGTFDQKILNDEGHAFIIDEHTTKRIRDIVLAKYTPKKIYNRVYIARGNNGRLVNESKLISILKKHGFEIFYPDHASFEDEIDCFLTANCIVLCAGAAITNIIYCKKNVKIYQICPWEFQCSAGIPIEDSSGLVIYKISGKLIKKGQLMNQSKFMIEKSDIKRIINEAGL